MSKAIEAAKEIIHELMLKGLTEDQSIGLERITAIIESAIAEDKADLLDAVGPFWLFLEWLPESMDDSEIIAEVDPKDGPFLRVGDFRRLAEEHKKWRGDK